MMVARTRSVEVEAAVLEAAEAILLAEGPDSLSVRHLATTAGVAPMSVYNHFGSKNGVVEALFVAGFARLEEALRTVGEIADPTEALLEAGRRYRLLALEQPATYQVMFGQRCPATPPATQPWGSRWPPSATWSRPSSAPWPPACSHRSSRGSPPR